MSQGRPGASRWAIGGRNKTELSNLRLGLAAGTSQSRPAIVVADLQDLASLQAMTQQAKVVLTYAGPYGEYGGENLIKAALSTCTDYVDITGEQHWKAQMLYKYEDEAQARGLAVVQSAGFDSLPADLLSMLVAEGVASDGQGPPSEVAVLFTKMNGGRSGGSVASAAWEMSHYSFPGPYDIAPGAMQVPSLPATTLFKEPQLPYFMSISDLPVIHRSMNLRFPEVGISVSETESTSVSANSEEFNSDPRMQSDPMPDDLQPGEGPPEWMLQAGSFAAKARARRSADGRTVTINLDGAGDPGYQWCARASVELALGLARHGPAATGFPTPSLAVSATGLREILGVADGGRLVNFTDL